MRKILSSAGIICTLLFFSTYSANAQSLGCTDTVVASSMFASEGNAIEAYDANGGTRWGTGASDPQWLAFQLDTIYNISQMVIRWEAANAKNYRIEGSNDTAQGWTTIRQLTNRPSTLGVGNGDRYDTISNMVGAYKYIRIYGTARTTPYGYSIWEVRFCGEKNRAVSGNSAPSAVATSDVNSGNVPFTVNFTGSASTDADSDPLSYSWSFGDGTHSTQANPSHLYANAGVYKATLTVSDGNNGFDTASVFINAVTIPNNPVANCGQPTINSAYASSGNAALAADGNMATRWESAFNDPEWIVFELDSIYTLNTMVINWETASASDYTVEGTNDTSTGNWTTLATKTGLPGTANRIDTVFNLTGNYQYIRVYGTARATVYGYSIFEAQFCGTGFAKGFSPNQAPTASFTATPVLGNEPLLVNFNASASSDPDGDTLTYNWNFGDGNFGTDTTTSHTYTVAGVYWAKLTVDDGKGATDIDSVMITVNSVGVNNAPVLSYTVSPVTGRFPLEVFVDASASTDVDNDPLTYTWNFNNGTTSNNAIDSVTYAMPGQYYVSILLTDGTDTVMDSTLVTVNPNTPPTASFTTNTTSGPAPLMVIFDASASADVDGDTLTYSWNFGDGNTGSDTTTTHTYASVGTYWAVLSVDDGHGGTAMDSVQIQVYSNAAVTNCGNSIISSAWASEEITGFEANLAFDGNVNSRWGTGATDPQWIAFELNGTYNLNGIIINWEAANAQDYEIQGSNDTSMAWTTIASRVNMPVTFGQTPSNRIDTVNALTGAYKYVRIYGTSRTTPFGYSIFEVSICGQNANSAPVPSIVATPTSGNSPLTVTFDATGTIDPDMDALSFSWDFDNGLSATGDSIDFTFLNTGIFDVVLTVNDGNGNIVTDTVTITVTAPVGGVTNCSVAYIDSVWATSGIAELAADGSMGTRWESAFSDTENIYFRLDNEYILNGMIIFWETASAKTYFVEATNDTNLGWTPVAYKYNLPATPNRVDTLDISGTYKYLRMRGVERSTPYGYSIFEVEVCGNRTNVAPLPSVTATPQSGFTPLVVAFDASATTDADGDSLTFTWNFGDGNTGTGDMPTNTYVNPGTFTAVVTIDDGFGGVVTDSVIITTTNSAPVASFTANPVTGLAPLVVNFDASATTDADNDPLTYSWNFGEGNTGSGVTTSHTYDTVNTFTAVLTVDDGKGGISQDSITITITGRVGLDENSFGVITLYPNPAQDFIYLQAENVEIAEYTISDINGRTLNAIKVNKRGNLEVNTSELANGIYFLNLVTDQGQKRSLRFLKN